METLPPEQNKYLTTFDFLNFDWTHKADDPDPS